MKRHIGAHVSIAGGVKNAPSRGTEIGANALGIFTKNQRQWSAKALDESEITAFREALGEAGFEAAQILVHASYLINLANPEKEKRSKSLDALLDEAQRVEQLGLLYLNFHPGSGLGKLEEAEAIRHIAEGVNEVLSRTTSAVLVLENTAGQGAHVGYQFEHLAQIMELSDQPQRVRVCIDTCHAFAAGYDVKSQSGYEKTVQDLAGIIGMDRLAGFHINDSATGLSSRKDRHASIGQGEIGEEAFARLLSDDRIPDVPFVLETPDPSLWEEEISRLRSATGE